MKSQGYIILLAFLFLSTLGFSSLAHADHASHHSCLFNLANNCATLANPVNSALEHLSSLQSSVQASLAQSNILALLLLAFSFIIAGLLSIKARPKILAYFQNHKARSSENLFEFQSRFLAWLSILNKRDPLMFATAR
ncbi:MAG: hypothetical protein G01um101420_864 [Parcubacteria group bacterium Gr01-1014_20]|nr:MAG: hypothetical protein G01um101420_864 [Parcubacteria group bacterium Gr01-1014_20]